MRYVLLSSIVCLGLASCGTPAQQAQEQSLCTDASLGIMVANTIAPTLTAKVPGAGQAINSICSAAFHAANPTAPGTVATPSNPNGQ